MTARPTPLTGKQSRHLRALAHSLKPVVQLGKQGWTAAVSAQIDEALLAHELIKIKVGGESPIELDELSAHLETELGASVAQHIGNIVVAYRRHPQKPTIELPKKSPKPAKPASSS